MLPIPPLPAVCGADSFVRWAIPDIRGAFANTLSFSDALRVRIGG